MNLVALLENYCEQGIISEIDLELSRFFKNHHPGVEDSVLLAVCMLSYVYRQGDVCLLLQKYAGEPLFEQEKDLAKLQAPAYETWIRALTNAAFVGRPDEYQPLILDDSGRLYLHKLWKYEDNLARRLMQRSGLESTTVDNKLLADGLQRLFPNGESKINWQQIAAAKAVKKRLSVISGGPGTGKTSTVVRILALLIEQAQGREKLKIALAAPTGKAAARLKDSILAAKQQLPVTGQVRSLIPEQTKTLHQLLGARKHTSKFNFNSENPLPYDVVVIDEASMIDQALMSKLLDALVEHTRLILLGDKNQLASVEAGSVLGDICDFNENHLSTQTAEWLLDVLPRETELEGLKSTTALTDNITLLTKSYRFSSDSGIARLAGHINKGDDTGAIQILEDPHFVDVGLVDIPDRGGLEKLLNEKVITAFKAIRKANSPKAAMDIFNRFRLLSPHRKGPLGVEYLNTFIHKLLQSQGLIPKYHQWYAGRPVIINENNYTLSLHNGDTGICLPDENGELKVFFEDEQSYRAIAPSRLPSHSTAFALTVHKSQGSEFDEVFLILPVQFSKILSRELLYTALTRARTRATIAGKQSVLSRGIKAQVVRSSGLRERLWA